LHSGDYDTYLTVNWSFYRGIVAALTKLGSHKRPEVQQMLESELRDYVAEELIATGRLIQLVPAGYAHGFEQRTIDETSALLALQGLIQQESLFARPRDRTVSGGASRREPSTDLLNPQF
jgi:hypothetical protein